MISKTLIRVAGALALAFSANGVASAGDPYTYTDNWARVAANNYAWHGQYYHPRYNAPVALVVPPTAHMRTQYSWGVSQNLMYPIHHQFGMGAPGNGYSGPAGFRVAPQWPSHTDQFGIHYVRGPW